MARRTFSSIVLLYNNVPMEIVSELLGHTKLATTQQSYGKIVQKKIGEEMRRLKVRGSPIFMKENNACIALTL